MWREVTVRRAEGAVHMAAPDECSSTMSQYQRTLMTSTMSMAISEHHDTKITSMAISKTSMLSVECPWTTGGRRREEPMRLAATTTRRLPPHAVTTTKLSHTRQIITLHVPVILLSLMNPQDKNIYNFFCLSNTEFTWNVVNYL